MSTDALRSAPDIQEIKSLLGDILAHGHREKVANVLGVTRKDISNRLSPDENRKPGLVEGLREYWAICVVSQEAGRKLRAYIDGLSDSWLNPPVGTDKNLATLIGEAGEEMATLSRMRHEGKPIHEQREQALAARAALDQFLAALETQFELKSEVSPIRKINR